MRIKICMILCFVMVCMVNQVFAIAPLNENLIKQAQLYGSSQAQAELSYFLKPWLAYEEKAEKLDHTVEQAHLYTPFLLIAMDAREKKLHNQPIKLADSEKIIIDYLDTLSFSVRLAGKDAAFSKKTTAVIVQKEKTLKTWTSSVPEKAEAAGAAGKYEAQGYFYFDERQLDLKEPVTLVVTTGDQRVHRFYFALAQIK